MKISNIMSRRNRILLRELVITDFKLRYQGSVLGYLWSLLKPLLLFAILYVVFVRFLRFGSDVEHYPIYLLLGIVLWGFFVESTNQGMQAIISRGDLIRKINFPKYIVVVSGTISALINLLLNLVVVYVFMIFNGVHIHGTILLFPFDVLGLYIIALAISFLLSSLYVKYRDIAYIWEVVLQGAFYAVPIIYPISMVIKVNALAAKILLLNPVAQIIQQSRYDLITHQTITTQNLMGSDWVLLVPFAITIVIVVGAAYYFRKNSKYFAENV